MPKRKDGQPSRGPVKYDKEVAKHICLLIMEGMSLNDITQMEGMPKKNTVLTWIHKHEEFRNQYFEARKAQMHGFAEDILQIADDDSADWKTVEKRNGTVVQVLDHEAVSRSKLRIDTRWRLMCALAPNVYSDRQKVQHEATGVLARLIIKDE